MKSISEINYEILTVRENAGVWMANCFSASCRKFGSLQGEGETGIEDYAISTLSILWLRKVILKICIIYFLTKNDRFYVFSFPA